MLFVKRLGGGRRLTTGSNNTVHPVHPALFYTLISPTQLLCRSTQSTVCADAPANLCRLFPWACGCARVFVCLSAKFDLCVCCVRLGRNSVYRATDGSRALSTSPRSRQLVSPAGRGDGERRRDYRANHPESLQTCRKRLINIGYFDRHLRAKFPN